MLDHSYESALKKLEVFSQTHLLKYYGELAPAERESLLKQIAETDFSVVHTGKTDAERGTISPIPVTELDEIASKRDEFFASGMDEIRGGRVGAVLLAGGMGTRLGSDAPKGVYNIGITKELYIFECLFNNLMDITRIAGNSVHLFIMTSDKNHEATVGFLKEKAFFGYDEDYVHFFMQEMAPASDYNGKVYLEEKWKISTSPNGNGGWYSSMAKWGMLDIVKENGIEWLNVFAVDNVLQRIADPVFIGATKTAGCSVGSKVIKKAEPNERVGVMCLEDGRPSIVEYYELTDEMRSAVNDDGKPAYNFGVILNYLFRVGELNEIMNAKLPMHIVEKKIPCLDENGEKVEPEAPNGYKFETLILDMIHLLNGCMVFEVLREKEFAPIKNKTGVDSVESARELLKKNGVQL